MPEQRSLHSSIVASLVVFVTIFSLSPESYAQEKTQTPADKIQELKKAFLDVEGTRGAAAPETILAKNALATAMAESGDFDGAFAMAKENFESVVANVDPKADYELPMQVNLLLSQLYFAKKQPEKAIGSRKELVEWGKEKAGEEHVSTLSFKTALAKTFADAGKMDEAISVNESVIGLLESKLPADHTIVIVNQKHLLDWHQASGNHEKAIKYGTKCLSTLLKKDGQIDSIMLDVVEKIADSYRATEEYGEILPWMQKALALCAGRIRPDNPRLLQFKTAAARAYFESGDKDTAISLMEEVVSRYSQLVGESHDATISTRSLLSMHYKANRQFEKAIANNQPLLNIMTAKYGTKHPTVLGLLEGMANLHKQAGNQDASQRIMKEVGEVRGQLSSQLAEAKKRFDEDKKNSPKILPESTSALISAYSKSGKNDEAIELAGKFQEQCIERQGLASVQALGANSLLTSVLFLSGRERDFFDRRIEFVQRLDTELGSNKPPTLIAKLALAGTLWRLGKQRQSVGLSEDTLKKMATDPGRENVYFVQGSIELADRYFEVGMLKEASLHFEANYENLCKVSDEHDAALISTRIRLGTIRINQNDAEGAIELLQKAYISLSDGPSKNVAEANDTANLLALAKWKSGELENAISLFNWVSGESREGSVTWLGAQEGVANVLVAQKKFDDAEKQLKKLIAAQEKFLGREHPETRRVRQTLAGVYSSLGKKDLEKSLLEELNSKAGK